MKKPIYLDYINADMPEAKNYFIILNGELAGYGTEAKAGYLTGWVNVWNSQTNSEETLYGNVDIRNIDDVLDKGENYSFVDIPTAIYEQNKQESLFEHNVASPDLGHRYYHIYMVVWNGKVVHSPISVKAGSDGWIKAWAFSRKDEMNFLCSDPVILTGQVRILTRKKVKELNLPEVWAGDI